jgi:hypothetical protein
VPDRHAEREADPHLAAGAGREVLDQVIGDWLRALAAAGRLEGLLTAIAIDGEWLRSVADGQVKLFAAMLHEEKVIIAQHRIPDDTSEITQVEELLDPVDLTDAVVTADAAQAQHDTAEYIGGKRNRPEERARLPAGTGLPAAGPVHPTGRRAARRRRRRGCRSSLLQDGLVHACPVGARPQVEHATGCRPVEVQRQFHHRQGVRHVQSRQVVRNPCRPAARGRLLGE